ncbi:MAG: glycosyltransferase [Candidatus Eremiobacteraeota bacterium]|nr:glycosyltransferase [Candidatus Eremiobacteraeota bacterium]
MRVALVHDYLNQRGGAERVFAHIARAFPDAPIYTALFDPRATGDLIDPARVRTSWLQRVPFANRAFRLFAPLYPSIFEGFDLSGFDTIVSSTTAWAKGVRFGPGAVHVCYINTVSRFAFDYDRYVGALGFGTLARPFVRRLVRWDRAAAERPTAYIANSHNVAARVRAYYGREAAVLHCPVDVDRFSAGDGRGEYFLAVSRLLPYKRIDVAIAACALAGVPLKVVGDGPARRTLEGLAAGTRTEFLGPVGDAELRGLMQEARAVIVPGEEDYGLVPLEANASGRPVLAYGGGGALETVVSGVTGELFAEQSGASLAAMLRDFDPRRYDAGVLRAHALTFSPERFIERLRAIVEDVRSGRGGFEQQP